MLMICALISVNIILYQKIIYVYVYGIYLYTDKYKHKYLLSL